MKIIEFQQSRKIELWGVRCTDILILASSQAWSYLVRMDSSWQRKGKRSEERMEEEMGRKE